MTPRIANYQLRKCKQNRWVVWRRVKERVNCPVCRDGFRNYYYRPLKCPHSAQKELHPELSSDDDDEEDEDSVENWSEP